MNNDIIRPSSGINGDEIDVKQKSLFARLKKLFSAGVVVRNVGGKKLKVKDTSDLMYATDRNSLRDRFNRVRSTSYNAYTRDFSLAYQAARIDLFRDYDTMDLDPIIASALDIYSDECVHGDTIIPLLNGEKIKISDLYLQNRKDFWVYSIDENGRFIPSKCEKVALNGKKKMLKVLLDDGTEIKCTANHQWVKSDGTIITTDKLEHGTSLKVFRTTLSTNKFMNGYEMLLENGKWKYTHRIVANYIPELIECRNKILSEDKVIHHSSFNKKNNDPSVLQWMTYKEHRLVHSQFNKELWADDSRTHEYKEKTREGHRKYWTEEKRKFVSVRQKAFMNNFISNMTELERKEMYGLNGLKNGMFGYGEKLSGNKNGRWKNFNSINKININEYENDIINGLKSVDLGKKYNISRKDRNDINNQICKKYNIYRIYQLKNVFENSITIPIIDIKNLALEELKCGNNILRNLSIVSSKYNLTNKQLWWYIRSKGYKGIKDLINSNNHRVVSIQEDGEYNAYDLVNVGNSTHLYAIETQDGSKLFTHNCLTINEMGKVLVVNAEDDNIKGILTNLFYDVLNIEHNLWSWTRNTCKYGDFFMRLYISPEYGVYQIEPISAYNVERLENTDPLNKNYVKFQIRPTDTSQVETLESFECAHFRLLSDSNFLPYGKCLVSTTHIDTEFGSKYIKDLDIGEFVWSFNTKTKNFELTKVVNKICSGTKEIIRISTQHNFVDSSKNHRFLVFNTENKNLEYKIAENIKIGDLLVINSNKNKKSKETILIDKNILDNKQITCPIFVPEKDEIPDVIDNEFAEFFGFMVGDGWAKYYPNKNGISANYRVCFSLGVDEEQNKRYLSILEKYAGKKANITFHGGKSRTAILYSKRLYKILKNMGFGDNAKEKRIPSWVFESNNEIQNAFIIGLGNADGWTHEDEWAKCYSIMLCNKDLIYDFKKLVQLNNIKSSNPKENDKIEEVEIRGIKCNKHGEYSFNYYFDADEKQQMEKYNFIDNKNIFLEPVRKIEDRGEKETYDIQVESLNSNFIANGIIVHNSMIEGGRRVWKQLCLHQNSEIWTNIGYQKIKDIKPNTVVYSYNYEKCVVEPTKVINCVKTGNKKTLEVKTKHRVLHLTETHDVLVKNSDGNYLYKKAKDLIVNKKNGDCLVLPTIESDNKDYTIKLNPKLYYAKLNNIGIEYIKNYNKVGIINRIKSTIKNHPYKQVHAFLMGDKSLPFNIFVDVQKEFKITNEMYFLHIKNSKNPSFVNKDFTFTLDENFIRFFGFMLGDGWTTKNGLGFANGIYSEINEKYTSIIKKYSDSICVTYPKNNDTHPGCTLTYSKELKYIMETAGYLTGFRNKRIPEWVFNLSKQNKKEFIKGLFDADGSWKWSVIGLSNKEMITQLKHLCQQSGIMCNEVKCYKPEETIDELGIHRFPTYKLYINFNQEYDLDFERILSIETYEENSSVYDIMVESDNHNFIANGVVVHNSLLEDAMLINRIMRAPERRIFKIDIGNIPPQDVDSFMEKMISKTKKVPYVDQNTGDYNLRFNLQNMVEDFYLPVRGTDSGTSIETLSGIEWTGIDDVEYIRNKMMAALKIPKAFLGYESELSGKATLACIVPETKIPLLSGITKTVEELIKDYEIGIKNYVYSIDETTKNIVPGEIEWAGYTRMNTDIIRVHLDNNEYIDCTPDHNFMTRDGKWIEAKDLTEGQSLMPLYKRNKLMYGKSDYEQIYNPATEKWEWTHKRIDDHINGKLIQPHIKNKTKFNRNDLVIVHHDNFSRSDNSPPNLKRLTFLEHRNIHKDHTYETFCSPEAIAYKKSDEFRKKKSLERINYINNNPEEKERLKKNLAQYKFNSIEWSEMCKNKWKKDSGNRKELLRENNKKYKKSSLMVEAFRKSKGFNNPLPTFIDLVQFSTENGYNTKLVSKSLECGKAYIHKLIYENGYNSIRDFSKKYVKNHKVIKIERLSEKRDTCDITIKNYHNFATSAGVIIHNSEDVRFARTIQRVQRILISELEKIAIVHLYAQGYRDESLVNFKLELTNPSTIFEKEKIEVWSNKVEVASRMMEIKLFPKEWVYKNVFNLSEDDVEGLRDEIVDDSKQLYRFRSIEEEGNDPAQPFKKINPNPNAQPGMGGGGDLGLGGGGLGGGGGLVGGGGIGGSELGGPGGELGGLGGPPIMETEKNEDKEVVIENPVEESNDDHSEEYKRNRDQSGEKDARADYPFGEDPLGNIENNSKPRPGSAITHKFSKKSPLSIDEAKKKEENKKRVATMKKGNVIKSLDAYLSKKGSEKKNLIKETNGNKSIMDPEILIDE